MLTLAGVSLPTLAEATRFTAADIHNCTTADADQLDKLIGILHDNRSRIRAELDSQAVDAAPSGYDDLDIIHSAPLTRWDVWNEELDDVIDGTVELWCRYDTDVPSEYGSPGVCDATNGTLAQTFPARGHMINFCMSNLAGWDGLAGTSQHDLAMASTLAHEIMHHVVLGADQPWPADMSAPDPFKTMNAAVTNALATPDLRAGVSRVEWTGFDTSTGEFEYDLVCRTTNIQPWAHTDRLFHWNDGLNCNTGSPGSDCRNVQTTTEISVSNDATSAYATDTATVSPRHGLTGVDSPAFALTLTPPESLTDANVAVCEADIDDDQLELDGDENNNESAGFEIDSMVDARIDSWPVGTPVAHWGKPDPYNGTSATADVLAYTFAVRVINEDADTPMPRFGVALRYDEPWSGNQVEVHVDAEALAPATARDITAAPELLTVYLPMDSSANLDGSVSQTLRWAIVDSTTSWSTAVLQDRNATNNVIEYAISAATELPDMAVDELVVGPSAVVDHVDVDYSLRNRGFMAYGTTSPLEVYVAVGSASATYSGSVTRGAITMPGDLLPAAHTETYAIPAQCDPAVSYTADFRPDPSLDRNAANNVASIELGEACVDGAWEDVYLLLEYADALDYIDTFSWKQVYKEWSKIAEYVEDFRMMDPSLPDWPTSISFVPDLPAAITSLPTEDQWPLVGRGTVCDDGAYLHAVSFRASLDASALCTTAIDLSFVPAVELGHTPAPFDQLPAEW